jgi:hypothetical protein
MAKKSRKRSTTRRKRTVRRTTHKKIIKRSLKKNVRKTCIKRILNRKMSRKYIGGEYKGDPRTENLEKSIMNDRKFIYHPTTGIKLSLNDVIKFNTKSNNTNIKGKILNIICMMNENEECYDYAIHIKQYDTDKQTYYKLSTITKITKIYEV